MEADEERAFVFFGDGRNADIGRLQRAIRGVADARVVVVLTSADAAARNLGRLLQWPNKNVSVVHLACETTEQSCVRLGQRVLGARLPIVVRPIEKIEDARTLINATPTTAGEPTETGNRVVVFPHNAYHVLTYALIRDELQQLGVQSVAVDISEHRADEGARAKAEDLDVPLLSYTEFLSLVTDATDPLRPTCIVAFNDWELITRSVVRCAHDAGLPTIALVEGIQDYHDADTGRTRNAYRSCDHVLLPGEFDSKYFPGTTQSLDVVGIPRLRKLIDHATPPPGSGKVLINSNFTYGVLTNQRDRWLDSAVRAVQDAGFTPVLSRHVADVGTTYEELRTDEDFYTAMSGADCLVSRFSSCILEALAMQRTVIYFNPHGEKVDKFKEPMGAYETASTATELSEALRSVVGPPPPESASDFLRLHSSGINPLGETIASYLKEDGIDYERFSNLLLAIDKSTRALTCKEPLEAIGATFAP